MSKMKNFDLALYNSIEDGIRSVMAPFKVARPTDKNQLVFSKEALSNALAFLCLNDIQHQYIVTEANPLKNKPKLVTVCWTEGDTETSFSWIERNPLEEFYLIKYDDNWADEMDVSGFIVCNFQEMSDWKKAMSNLKEIMQYSYFTHQIGSNEEIMYTTFEEFDSCFEVCHITKREYESIKDIFGREYGLIPYEQVLDFIEDYRKEQEEEE